MDKIRVFLVDDHFIVCEGLQRMLEQEEDIRVVGEAHSGEEAIPALAHTTVDVVLLDIRMSGMDGIETLIGLKSQSPDLKVIMLTSHGDEYLAAAIEAGANGYLLKRANREEMVKAIREAARGGAPLDSQVTPALLRRLRDPVQSSGAPLSPRETEVLELAAQGLGNAAIAHDLVVSQTTVKNHMTSIMQKLNANDRTHAVTIALGRRWISIPSEQTSGSTNDYYDTRAESRINR